MTKSRGKLAARRQAAVLSLALRVASDRRQRSAGEARAKGRHAVPASLDAIETDAAMMREAADVIAEYHALLGPDARAERAGEIIDFAQSIGLEISE